MGDADHAIDATQGVQEMLCNLQRTLPAPWGPNNTCVQSIDTEVRIYIRKQESRKTQKTRFRPRK